MGNVVTEVVTGCIGLRLLNTDANLLTIDVIRELSQSLRDAKGTPGAIMICGGERFFSNGLDLTWALSRTADDLRQMFLSLGELVLQMLECPVPLVGAIKGHAIGAGKTLFAACDYRYAAKGRVLIGMPEILLGVPNPYFADQLTRHIVGDAVASDFIYRGKLVAAETCVANGLVSQVFDKADVEGEAWKKALELAALPRAAFAECKSMRTARLCADIRANTAERIDRLIDIWARPETQARLKAAAQRLSK